jgi:mannose-6-phosphate isomerase-like protein (cupin superfamily)
MVTITGEQEALRFGPGGGTYRIVTHAAETGGLLFALNVTEPPGGGPPLHVHRNEDEYFAVLEGEGTFYVDGRVRTVGTGGAVFGPRGVPHTFKNCSDRPLRMLVVCTPGEIERFFDYGLPVGPQGNERPPDEYLIGRMMQLAPECGLQVLGLSPL